MFFIAFSAYFCFSEILLHFLVFFVQHAVFCTFVPTFSLSLLKLTIFKPGFVLPEK